VIGFSLPRGGVSVHIPSTKRALDGDIVPRYTTVMEINYEKLRGAWENTILRNPRLARQIGPPNWLVKERLRKDENFLDAAVRVREEDFRRLNVPTMMSPVGGVSPAIVPTNGDVPTICPQCGERPREAKRKLCGACRKKNQRAK